MQFSLEMNAAFPLNKLPGPAFTNGKWSSWILVANKYIGG